MVELNEEARGYLTSDDAVSAMMAQYGAPTIASTVSAIDYGVPLVVDGLKRRAEDSAGIVNLLNLVRSLDTSQLGTPTMWGRASHRSDMGPDLLETIFRDHEGQTAHEAIVRKLAERSRVAPATAHGILGSCAWTMLAVLVNRYSRSLDRQTLLGVTDHERTLLSAQGWDPWIRSVEWERSAVASNDTIRASGSGMTPPVLASADRAGRYPPPVSRGDRGDSGPQPPVRGSDRDVGFGSGVGGYAPPQRSRGQGPPSDYAAPRGGDYGDGRGPSRHRPMVQPQQPMARHTRPRMAPPEPEPRRWPIVLAVAALLLIGGGAFWLLGRDGDTTDTSETAQATEATDDAEAATDATTDEEAAVDTAEEATTDEPVDPGIYTGMVTMDVPMKDIFTFDDTQAEGTVQISIDADSGETCAVVNTANVGGPYNSHIHLGAYPERGPIVVDFEPMTDGVQQCVANDITDINEILADRSEFYVEMHDAGGIYTVRGQLSEATIFEDQRDPAAIPELDDDSDAFDTDPNQNGALVRFQNGSLLAQGAVGDQMIVDELIAALEASGVPVTNELRVEPGSPPPSGRFVANEGLTFPIGGDQLSGDNSEVLQAMAAIINANPGWKLSIVGHTDDTGDRADNLELSRRRAGSVRTALEELGVSTDVLKVAGFGPDQPIGDNNTPAGRQQNRRIEFIIDPT